MEVYQSPFISLPEEPLSPTNARARELLTRRIEEIRSAQQDLASRIGDAVGAPVPDPTLFWSLRSQIGDLLAREAKLRRDLDDYYKAIKPDRAAELDRLNERADAARKSVWKKLAGIGYEDGTVSAAMVDCHPDVRNLISAAMTAFNHNHDNAHAEFNRQRLEMVLGELSLHKERMLKMTA